MASTLTQVNSAKQDTLEKYGTEAFQCVFALVQFVLADPLLRSTFISFLQTLKAQIIAEKSLIQLVIGQSTVAVALINSQVAAAEAVLGVTTGLGDRFPLGVFMRCPVIADTVHAVTGDKAGSTRPINPMEQAKNKIKELKYQLRVLQIKIEKMSSQVAQFTLIEDQIDSLINLFNVLADFPG